MALAGLLGWHRPLVVPAAPRIDPRLVAIIRRVDRPGRSIADINRRVGAAAEHLGLPRPGYEQVRVLVHAVRRRRAASAELGEVLLDVSFRARPPTDLIALLSDSLPPPRR